jgi:hypothetical protein
LQRVSLEIVRHVYQHCGVSLLLEAGIIPASLPSISCLDKPSRLAGFVVLLAQYNDDACQFILTNCLAQLILYTESHFSSFLNHIISKGTISQLSTAFSDIFARKMNQKTQMEMLQFFGELWLSHDTSDIMLQAMSNSNFLKFPLEVMRLNYDDRSQSLCLKIISSYGSCCHKTTTDASVLESFIPCIIKYRSYWDVLLPCVAQIINNIPNPTKDIPSDLVSLLLSLEICEDLLRCVLEICQEILERGDDQFLQLLVDNGLLSFLISASESDLKSSCQAFNLLHHFESF